MGAQQQSWIIDILRSIFSALDSMVYGLINWILYGIFDLMTIENFKRGARNAKLFNTKTSDSNFLGIA